MRSWSVLQALASQGHEIHLVAFGDREQLEAAELRAACKTATAVEHATESLSSGKQYLRRFLALPSRLPFSVLRFRSDGMRKAIEVAVASSRPHAILCDTVFPAVNLPNTDIPIVLNTHNVEHLILSRFAENEENWAAQAYARLESLKLKGWERTICGRSRSVMACSDVDGAILAGLGAQGRVCVVPNTIDVHRYAGRPAEEEEKTVLFTGGMDWYPNRDAVQYFAERCLPRLRQMAPGVKFTVAGRDGSPEFKKQMERFPEVRFTGRVEDMRDEIARAAVCVVPLRIGSGTRLKILEAAAMSKAIVSTSVGAEGLEFENEKDILRADDPTQFAELVASLLLDSRLRQKIGRAARLRVERQYSREALEISVSRALEWTGETVRIDLTANECEPVR